MVQNGKSSQEYTVNAGVPQLYVNNLPDDAICDAVICIDDIIFYSECDWVYDLWQRLELAFVLESDLIHCRLGQEVIYWFQC